MHDTLGRENQEIMISWQLFCQVSDLLKLPIFSFSFIIGKRHRDIELWELEEVLEKI